VPDVPVPFGVLLRKYRVAKGLTPAGLSLAAGFGKNTVARLEAGLNHPGVETITKLVEYLGLEDEEARALRLAGDVWPSGPARATEAFPTWASALEAPVDAIVDRATEVSALLAQLRGGHRLLTLTGPPGVGKSRIALEVARRLAEGSTQEGEEVSEGAAPPLVADIVSVDLATLRDAALVVPAIAAAVGLVEDEPGDLRVRLAAHLRERRLLLLLDNVDHVIAAPVPLDTIGPAPGVAPLLGLLVAPPPPDLRVLATSRKRLQVEGETEQPVDLLRPEPAVELFVVSARHTVRGFHLTAETRDIVLKICEQVDRLPLAIQLVAPRLRSFSPDQLLTRLDARLPYLADAAYQGASHHATMSAAIAWSHELLDEDARLVFRRLAVFAGGWTVASVEAVCAGGDGLAAPTLAIVVGVERLVDNNLVRPDGTGPEGPRYAMLEVIREFAGGCLERSGEGHIVRARHAAHFLDRASAAGPDIVAGDTDKRARLESEGGNLRAALDWLLATGYTNGALQLAHALWPLWRLGGRLTEGRNALERALALSGGDRWWRAQALLAASDLAHLQGDDDAALVLGEQAQDLDPFGVPLMRHLAEMARRRGDFRRAQRLVRWCLNAAELAGDRRALAETETLLGLLCRDLGMHAEAREAHELALTWYREVGNRRGEATARLNLGGTLLAAGDLNGARPHLDGALVQWRELGDAVGVARAASMRGELAVHEGERDLAIALLDEALPIHERAGDNHSLAVCMVVLGDAARLDGDTRLAAERYREGLTLAVRHRKLGAAAMAIEGFAALATAWGHGGHAARLLGAAAVARATIGDGLMPLYRAPHDELVRQVREIVGDAAYEAAFMSGQALTAGAILASEPGPG